MSSKAPIMAKYCSEAMEYGEAWGWSVKSGSASIVAADKAIEFRILKQGRAIGGKEAAIDVVLSLFGLILASWRALSSR